MAVADSLSGSDRPESLAWFPPLVLPLVGLLLAMSGVVVCIVLMRCHLGLVINSTKMRSVVEGRTDVAPLNWLGVTTNFVILIALSVLLGMLFCAGSILSMGLSMALGGAAVLGLLVLLPWNHRRAAALAQRLAPAWEKGEVSETLRERHIKASLDDASADMAIVVTMAAALFTGLFAAMSNLGNLDPALGSSLPIVAIQRWGICVLSGYMLISVLLSGRMVIRLRVAIADHSASLARLRNETDEPYRFQLLESSFLLHLVVVLLAAFAACLFGAALRDLATGLILAAVLTLWSILRYVFVLRRAARRSSLRG
ncbi:MAG: hypothetical protein KDB18_13995 [Salinibacterium sp.]|nr:hypothetical protein [Salinibacterium sp.]